MLRLGYANPMRGKSETCKKLQIVFGKSETCRASERHSRKTRQPDLQPHQQFPGIHFPAPPRLVSFEMNASQPIVDTVSSDKILVAVQYRFALFGDFE